MWQYGGMDVPVFEPGLTNLYGLGGFNYGFTQPIFGHTPNTIGCVGCGTSPMGYTPYVTPMNFVRPDVNPFFGIRSDWNPFFGIRNEWNPFLTMGTTPVFYNTPFGVDRLHTLNTLGINPWFVGGPFGLKLTEEIWKNSLPFTQPIYNLPVSFPTPVGIFGTPYGVTNYTPFGFNGLDEKVKFGTPITNGLFNIHSTPFQTPIDWKLKTFGTPVGLTTETWNKTLFPNFSWTTGRVPGPVAVL